jgi:hypothetical protein
VKHERIVIVIAKENAIKDVCTKELRADDVCLWWHGAAATS